MQRALYSQCHRRVPITIHESSEDNSPDSKLFVYQRCKLFDSFGPFLGHHTSAEKSVNYNLLESLPCAYRCCTLGGSLLSVHFFAIALYF